MKQNKGITMIEIVIVIIILILLAVIAVWNTRTPYNKAEGTNVYMEFKTLRNAAEMLITFYNTESLDDYVEGVHYCEKYTDPSGDVWFTLYGQDEPGKEWYASHDPDIYEKILDAWSLDELKRSYDILLDDKNVQIKYTDGRYVEVNNYKVHSFDEIKALQESGAF